MPNRKNLHLNIAIATIVTMATGLIAFDSQAIDSLDRLGGVDSFNCQASFNSTKENVALSALETNDFRVSRSLRDYTNNFPFKNTKTLFDTVLGLQKEHIWVDMGAGEGRALIEGLNLNPNVSKAIGIAFKKPTDSPDYQGPKGRYDYIDGAFVEDLAKAGELDHLFGKVELITDVYGPLSYTNDIIGILQLYVNLLKVGGTVYFNIMHDRNFEKFGDELRQLESPAAVNSVLMHGQPNILGLPTWLSQIQGIELLEATRSNASSKGNIEQSLAFRIKKTMVTVKIPQTLLLRSIRSSSPPARTFEYIRP